MTTLLAFVFTLALLIVVHELGHYLAARACGVRVLRFSVGFGRVLWSRMDQRGTEWAVSAIPLGGYVKMLDEREGKVAAEELPYAFNRQGVWRRIAIVAAGPLANLLLAVLLYWLLYLTGMPALKTLVGAPVPGSPAALAGIRAGEEVTHVKGEPVENWQELHLLVLRHGLGADDIELQTRNAQGHIAFRRLALGAVDSRSFEADPLGQLGLTRYTPPLAPVIGELQPGGVAARAGLKPGDAILQADGRTIARWDEVVEVIRAHPGKPVRLHVRRGGASFALELTPERVEQGGRVIGRIGAAPRTDPEQLRTLQTVVRYDVATAAVRALQKTWELAVFSLEMLARMVLGQVSLQNLSGPITIADYAGQSASAGWLPFFTFLALISISLAVINLLPVPVLDGGHLLYYCIELITGRPVSERIQAIGQRIGLALIGALMFLALYNDLARLFSR
ncbi:MAG: RIP metalloprotease RseP [Thiobacillaceae bacterium]|nr:RIP metalloprotease RseP [Thiobacillaceae bacterium]